MTFKTLKDLMERLPAERLKIVYSKGEMKESSCLVTSTKTQKHIVTALQLLEMHNLEPESITFILGTPMI